MSRLHTATANDGVVWSVGWSLWVTIMSHGKAIMMLFMMLTAWAH